MTNNTMDSFFPDVLTFPDDSNEAQMGQFYSGLSSNNNGSYFPQQGGNFQESNTNLNSFFPGSGLTPLQTPMGYSDLNSLQNYSWSNYLQMLNLAAYNKQQMQHQMTQNPNEVTAVDTANDSSTNRSSQPDTNEYQSKPKRGRPRKKREKKQLTAEEEDAKRQKFLERNRLAASKCRDRKKNWTQDTLDKLTREERQHSKMQIQYQELHTMIQDLLESACDHSVHCTKDSTFQQLLSEASNRFAAINGLHEMFTAPLEPVEYDYAEDAVSPGTEEPPHKRARRNSSLDVESVQSAGSTLHNPFSDREIRALKRESVDSSMGGQGEAMTRQGSTNSSGSGGDRDSGISVRGSPVNGKLQTPADESFFGSDTTSTSTTHYHTMPPVVMVSNPRLVAMSMVGQQNKGDAQLYAQNFATARS